MTDKPIPKWAMRAAYDALAPWRSNPSEDEDALVARLLVETREKALYEAIDAVSRITAHTCADDCAMNHAMAEHDLHRAHKAILDLTLKEPGS